MTKSIKKIAVFCGSGMGTDSSFSDDCRSLADVLCKNQMQLIYGGGNVGLMGILADEMLKAGGIVTGVIPQKLVEIEVAHSSLTNLHIVGGMHERKALMAELADAFIILPGGIGTMEEFFEIYTWHQLGYHNKPIGIANIKGFYDKLIDFLDHLVNNRFVKQEQISKLIIRSRSAEIVDEFLKLHQPLWMESDKQSL